LTAWRAKALKPAKRLLMNILSIEQPYNSLSMLPELVNQCDFSGISRSSIAARALAAAARICLNS